MVGCGSFLVWWSVHNFVQGAKPPSLHRSIISLTRPSPPTHTEKQARVKEDLFGGHGIDAADQDAADDIDDGPLGGMTKKKKRAPIPPAFVRPGRGRKRRAAAAATAVVADDAEEASLKGKAGRKAASSDAGSDSDSRREAEHRDAAAAAATTDLGAALLAARRTASAATTTTVTVGTGEGAPVVAGEEDKEIIGPEPRPKAAGAASSKGKQPVVGEMQEKELVAAAGVGRRRRKKGSVSSNLPLPIVIGPALNVTTGVGEMAALLAGF